ARRDGHIGGPPSEGARHQRWSFSAALRSSLTICMISSLGHLGQVDLVAGCQQLIWQALLRIDQGVNLLLYRAAANELVYQDVLLLADPERPVGSLVLDRWIPPAIEMHDMGCRGQGQTGATRLQ